MAYGFIPSTTGYGYKVLSGQVPIIPVTPQKEEEKKEEQKNTSSYTGVDLASVMKNTHRKRIIPQARKIKPRLHQAVKAQRALLQNRKTSKIQTTAFLMMQRAQRKRKSLRAKIPSNGFRHLRKWQRMTRTTRFS